MTNLLALSLLLSIATPAVAQTHHAAKPAEAAKPTTPAPVENASKDSPAPSGQGFIIETPGSAVANPGLDTPIAQLVADPRTKAVLDKDLPGLSDDSNLGKFSDKSLRQFQPLTGGQLTDALLKQTGDDLVALGSVPATTTNPEDAPPTDHVVEQKSEAPVSSSNGDEDKPR